MKKVLITGSKEYPLGTNADYDPEPSGGMEVYTQHLANRLSRKYELTVMTRKFPHTLMKERVNRANVERIPFVRGRLIRNASFNLLSAFKTLFNDYDVLITQDLVASFLGVFVSKLKRKPHIAVCHGLVSVQPQFSSPFKLLIRLMEKIAFNLSTITVTHCPEEQIRKITKRYKIIKPGMNKEFSPSQKKKSYKGKVIIFTGRLIKVKGVEYLINSLPTLKFDYTCIIVGDGPEREGLEKLAKKIGANVVFEGQVQDVGPFLEHADVFVLPSMSESLGYSMLEAMSLNVPCVVTDIGIISSKEAFIVPKKNPEAIAKAIKSVFSKQDITKEKVKNAKKFLKQFDWDKTVAAYIKIIKKLS